MAVHPIDHQLLPAVFSTPELTAIFDETARLQRWLDFEAALAASQAELGIIPAPAATAIRAAARLEIFTPEEIRAAYAGSKNSLVPLLTVLRRHCGPEAADYVHHGATTQDVLDTAQVLEQRATLAILYREMRSIADRLADLADRHRTTPMVGRTHGQHALPITLGLKFAGWLLEWRRNIRRCRARAENLRYGQLGGAVGTLAALGPQALEVADRTLGRLGLERPTLPWHSHRDTMADLAGFYGLVLTTCEKIAGEIFQLARPEIGELGEGRGGGSSTMPHKSNPVECQRLMVLVRHGRPLVGVVLEAAAHEHERDTRRLWSEWPAMSQLAIYTGTAVCRCREILDNLVIDPDRMLANLRQTGDALLTEHLVFVLAERIGKQAAQDLVRDLLARAATEGRPLRELVAEHDVGRDLDASIFEEPERYRGQADRLVADALARAAAEAAADPEDLFNREPRTP